MSLERQIELRVGDSAPIKVMLKFTEHDDQPDELRVTVRTSDIGDPDAEAVWHVQDDNGSFSLQITTQTVMKGICLAGCLAGIVSGTGPLVACLRKAKNRTDVRKCIDLTAVAQAVSALSCIYLCLKM